MLELGAGKENGRISMVFVTYPKEVRRDRTFIRMGEVRNFHYMCKETLKINTDSNWI